MKICKHIKSNAIVVVNNFQTVGIGAGQMNRVDSVEIACKKAANFMNEDGKVSAIKSMDWANTFQLK